MRRYASYPEVRVVLEEEEGLFLGVMSDTRELEGIGRTGRTRRTSSPNSLNSPNSPNSPSSLCSRSTRICDVRPSADDRQ